MSRHANPDLCGCGNAASTEPDRSNSAECGDVNTPRASSVSAVISTGPVSVIALIDDISVPVPASVTGLASASHWLERNFRDAGTAAFYRAERVADHPHLICGGVYAPTTELAFLARKAADERGGCRD